MGDGDAVLMAADGETTVMQCIMDPTRTNQKTIITSSVISLRIFH